MPDPAVLKISFDAPAVVGAGTAVDATGMPNKDLTIIIPVGSGTIRIESAPEEAGPWATLATYSATSVPRPYSLGAVHHGWLRAYRTGGTGALTIWAQSTPLPGGPRRGRLAQRVTRARPGRRATLGPLEQRGPPAPPGIPAPPAPPEPRGPRAIQARRARPLSVTLHSADPRARRMTPRPRAVP